MDIVLNFTALLGAFGVGATEVDIAVLERGGGVMKGSSTCPLRPKSLAAESQCGTSLCSISVARGRVLKLAARGKRVTLLEPWAMIGSS